ncbi:hypothetical protein ABE599_19525 [Achromobacter mucicolens]|jgi:hypothetical protein|uniref:hypothetical protein n=1 Tax=Achromobacter mucicolens TaxID=1389922 RepID=UPI00320AFB89
MKPMESSTDQKIRERLVSSVSYVFGNSIIRTFLERTFGALSSAYVLGHTPDQGEDFYVVLVNGSAIAKFELSRRPNAEPRNLVTISVEEYRKALRGRQSQLKLSIAIKLAAAHKPERPGVEIGF